LYLSQNRRNVTFSKNKEGFIALTQNEISRGIFLWRGPLLQVNAGVTGSSPDSRLVPSRTAARVAQGSIGDGGGRGIGRLQERSVVHNWAPIGALLVHHRGTLVGNCGWQGVAFVAHHTGGILHMLIAGQIARTSLDQGSQQSAQKEYLGKKIIAIVTPF